MFWLVLILLVAGLAAVFVALHNPLFKRLSSTGFRDYTSFKDYLQPWTVYLLVGLVGAFLTQLFLKFGPLVADLAIIPAGLGAGLAMAIFALVLYG